MYTGPHDAPHAAGSDEDRNVLKYKSKYIFIVSSGTGAISVPFNN
jgi:hypothetical protein